MIIKFYIKINTEAKNFEKGTTSMVSNVLKIALEVQDVGFGKIKRKRIDNAPFYVFFRTLAIWSRGMSGN